MKTYLLLYFSLVVSSLFAQKQLFNRALKYVRPAQSFYTVSTNSGSLLKNDLIEYAREHDFLVKNIYSRNTTVFGTYTEVVQSFEFLPQSEVEDYLYATLGSTFKSVGATLLDFDKIKTYRTGSAYIYIPNQSGFVACNNIYWTAGIENGKLQGKGQGYVFLPAGSRGVSTSCMFSGEFAGGILVGEGLFTNATMNESHPESSGNYQQRLSLSPFVNGMAALKRNGKYGFVATNGQITVPTIYSSIVQNFENGTAIVVNDKGEEILVNTNGVFIDYSPKQKEIYAQAERLKKEAMENFLANRRKAFSHLKNGDQICYSQQWERNPSLLEIIIDGCVGIPAKGTKFEVTAVLLVDKPDDINGNGKVRLICNRVVSPYNNVNSVQFDNQVFSSNSVNYLSVEDMIRNMAFQFCK